MPSRVFRVQRLAISGIAASPSTSVICPMVMYPPPPTPNTLRMRSVAASFVCRNESVCTK